MYIPLYRGQNEKNRYMTLFHPLPNFFTIEKLSKHDNMILIKAHPNFFNLTLESISKWDRKIFYEIKKKYDLKNIIFLDSPSKNENLLRAISKKTILISHHGTALLEGLFSGFKCVSSTSTFWDNNLKLTNNWDSLDKYHKVLNSDFDKLRFPRKSHLAYVSDQLFFNPAAEYGKKFWYKILIKELKKLKKIKKHSALTKLNFKINKNEELRIAKKISLNIEEISF